MAALTNEHYRQGGSIPSRAGATAGSLPIADSERQIGDVSDCMPAPYCQWLVLRTTSNRVFRARDSLSKSGIETYLPTRMVIKNVFGIRRKFQEPLLAGLLFVHSTKEAIDTFRAEHPVSAEFIKYYLDKTQGKDASGYNPPLVVSDADMDNFRKVCDTGDEHIMQINPKTVRFRGDEEVLITDGAFIGVKGRVVRVAGNQRVAVILGDTLGVATAYIPTAFLHILPKKQ